jgi:hypothetical protein
MRGLTTGIVERDLRISAIERRLEHSPGSASGTANLSPDSPKIANRIVRCERNDFPDFHDLILEYLASEGTL